MPVSVSRLRMWFAVAIVLLVTTVAGYYLISRYRFQIAANVAKKNLGIDIQQSTEGFSLSKSEGGRTLFKISAKKAVQYKSSGHAELRDVSIVVYGRDGSRFDRIYGSDFEYDSQTGIVSAKGEVQIDLEASAGGPTARDQAVPEELKNPIHLKTSGLVFDRNTGIAQTANVIEFRIPQASGSARGISYDSRANELTLQSDIRITTLNGTATTITAGRGVIKKEPRQAVLQQVRVEQPDQSIAAAGIVVHFREDNSIDRLTAHGGVEANGTGKQPFHLTAPQGELVAGEKSEMKLARFSGGVEFTGGGDRPLRGSGRELTLNFGPRNSIASARIAGRANLIQEPPDDRNDKGQRVAIQADVLDFTVADGRRLARAETSGTPQIVVDRPSGSTKKEDTTIITAGRFVGDFDKQSRLRKVVGTPEARIVSRTPGNADRIASSERLEVDFDSTGAILSAVQQGDFHYSERLPKNQGERLASASLARYLPAEEVFLLTGAPRMVQGGLTITANTLRINRRTGEAVADGNVKSTYSQLKPQPGGAMLASGEPIHVTARKMIARQDSGTAVYSGGARLWQAANTVEASQIEFDRDRRSLVAQSTGSTPRVTSVFVQQTENGRVVPVNVTARRLSYVDADRRARYEGGVTARSADGILTADHIDVLLKPAGAGGGDTRQPTPSQLDRIVATDSVVIQQPGRRATGGQVTYFADDGRFVLSGASPLVTDAQKGSVRGDSLTFFSRDDRVLVEGTKTAPAITNTRVNRE